MADPILGIEKLLRDEIDLYSRLYALEESKSGAIIDKDGRLLESISREQEELLSRVEGLEEARSRLGRELVGSGPSGGTPPTLSDVARHMGEEPAKGLVSIGMELKALLTKLGSLHKTNKRLIEDNLEFYDILLSGLKNTASFSAGYSAGGLEKPRVSGSMIINKTV